MDREEKTIYFQYILDRLLEWNDSIVMDKTNDFSILKSLKLLFFVSAAGGAGKEHNILIESVFNSFYAMPYGHVESEIYDSIKDSQGNLEYYHITYLKSTKVRDINVKDQLNSVILTQIDTTIDFLKTQNYNLVLMPQFDLVNLSHAWYSWQKFYSKAKEIGQRSQLIPSDVIIAEDKIFSLKPF